MVRYQLVWVLLLGLGAVLPASAAVEMRLEACDDTYFQTKYPTLVADEPAVGKAFDKMVQATGSTFVNHCAIEVPYQDGQAVPDLPRRLALDKTWWKVEWVNGVEKRIPQQHGMAVEYLLIPNSLGGTDRRVISLQVCRTLESCKRLGVPFAAPVHTPAPPRIPPAEY